MRNLTRSNRNRYQLRLLAVAVVGVIGLVAAGVGWASSGSSGAKSGVAGAQHMTSAVAVKTRKISGYGVLLVNPKGRTIYVFMKDQRRRVTCTGTCASFWPPVKWKSTSKLTAGGAAKASLLSSIKNPSGGRSITYSRYPLYTYSGDSAAGQAKGEGTTLNGGKWYVISAKGTLVKHKSSSASGGTTTTTTGGGGGWG